MITVTGQGYEYDIVPVITEVFVKNASYNRLSHSTKSRKVEALNFKDDFVIGI
jgi:hypothetical protein